jgi:hypothetical protein
MKQGIQSGCKHRMINTYGCYFLCLVELAERITRKEFGADIERLYGEFTRDEAMKKDCTILDPAHILGDLTHARYRFSRPKEKPDYPYYIIENTKPGYTHFTLCYEGEIWDPLPPDRAAAKHYTPRSYRLLIRE